MAEQETLPQFPPSLHRLPTILASQALQEARAEASNTIPFALEKLDTVLQEKQHGADVTSGTAGGLRRGQVTEIYGPPGVGKTALWTYEEAVRLTLNSLQVSASALRAGRRVLWLDAASTLPGPRLKQVLCNFRPANAEDTQSSTPEPNLETMLSNFTHYSVPTLPHLLALIAYIMDSFAPVDTGIIVVDSISTLIDVAYPRNADERPTSKRKENGRYLGNRRQAVIGELASKLAKLAAVKNIAILVTGHVVTKIKSEGSAVLRPAISGQDWDNTMATRILLFRDWAPDLDFRVDKSPSSHQSARFAGVLKTGGLSLSAKSEIGSVVAFTIAEDGVKELSLTTTSTTLYTAGNATRKQLSKRSNAEMADSEEEGNGSDGEYGWEEGDQLAAEGLVDDSYLTITPASVNHEAQTEHTAKPMVLSKVLDGS